MPIAAKLRGEEREQALVLWKGKGKGKRAFEMEQEASNGVDSKAARTARHALDELRP